MTNAACPKCGSRDTIVKKKGEFDQCDFEVSDRRTVNGIFKKLSDKNIGDIINIAGKIIGILIDNKTLMIYCKTCGYYGKMG